MSEETLNKQASIAEQMVAVRSRGLLNARDLSDEVERLGDWREHVRAYPIPLVLAAAAAAYWMVPSRPRAASPVAAAAVPSSRDSAATTSPVEAKPQNAGLTGAAMGFVGSLAANAIRSYISEQLHSLIQGNTDHDTQQRQTPHRFSRH